MTLPLDIIFSEGFLFPLPCSTIPLCTSTPLSIVGHVTYSLNCSPKTEDFEVLNAFITPILFPPLIYLIIAYFFNIFY